MTVALVVLLLVVLGAAVAGWNKALALNKKVAAGKKKLSQVETERSFLLNQTTQLAQENVQLKSRLNIATASSAHDA